MTSTERAAELMAALASPSGQALLRRLPVYDEATVLSVTARLRDEGVEPDLASAALTQSRLRSRARGRLGPLADRLLLTADGLEQATRPAVAARHAERFLACGVEHVWDLGSGLGVDSLAFAEAGLAVTAVERSAEVAVAATANLAPYPRARVVRADLDEVDPAVGDGAWLDPARRTPGVADARGRTRRVWRLSDLSPSWEQVLAVAARTAATGAKLSPGFRADDLPDGAEAEWVSLDGDVVECALWWGRAVRQPGITALVGTSDPAAPGTGGTRWHVVAPISDAPEPLATAAALGPFVAEPDRAVLAAGLTGTLSALVDGQELDHNVGYVSARAPTPVPWARWYAVEESLPLHPRPVRAWLREREIDRVTIKKRGVSTDPERFRSELRLRRRQGQEGTLILTRVAGTPTALVVRPLAG